MTSETNVWSEIFHGEIARRRWWWSGRRRDLAFLVVVLVPTTSLGYLRLKSYRWCWRRVRLEHRDAEGVMYYACLSWVFFVLIEIHSSSHVTSRSSSSEVRLSKIHYGGCESMKGPVFSLALCHG